MQATAKDLRFHSTNLLNAVKRGEEVIISYRGKSCAKLVGIDENMDKLNPQQDLFGLWKDNDKTQDVTAYTRNIRRGRFNVD